MVDVWDGLVPQEELDRLKADGFGADIELGSKPALVVIDVVMSFLGRRPGESGGDDYATACGDIGWERLPAIRHAIELAKASGIPVVFTKGSPGAARVVGGAIKLSRSPAQAQSVHSAGFPAELDGAPADLVIEKTKASAFFGTPLLTFLHQRSVDTLILAGTTTSGCVRATAVDGYSHGYAVAVVGDACFDRSPFAHASNLFDIQMKYGNVISVGSFANYVTSLTD